MKCIKPWCVHLWSTYAMINNGRQRAPSVLKDGVDTLLSFSFVKEIGQLKHQFCLNISFVICIKLLVMNIHQNIRAKIKTKMLMVVTIEIFIIIFSHFMLQNYHVSCSAFLSTFWSLSFVFISFVHISGVVWT